MRVAVVSAYCNESDQVLRRCMKSVERQAIPATHFMVCDGPGRPCVVEGERLRHIVLGQRHNDFGDTPRGIGAALALREGFEAICFLDADNIFQPDHLAILLEAARSHTADVVVASRYFLRPDGSVLNPRPNDGAHVDTSCLMLLGAALPHATTWLRIPRPLSYIGDRIFWSALRARGIKAVKVSRPTVGYTTMWPLHYKQMGEVPPSEGVRSLAPHQTAAVDWLRSLTSDAIRRLEQDLGMKIKPT